MLFKLLFPVYILQLYITTLVLVNVNHVKGSPPSSSSSPDNQVESDTSSVPSTVVNNVNSHPQSSASPSSSLSNEETLKDENCESRNSSCAQCVGSKRCFYCYPTSRCLPFSLRLTGCSTLKETAYGTCLVKSNVLAIALGSLAGVVLLAILITYCCCCRCQRKRSGWEVDNQKENLTIRGSVIRDNNYARREERQKRVDEIKRKYGIPDKKYSRF